MKIVYLNIGPSIEQLKISAVSAKRWNPIIEIVIFTDQPSSVLEQRQIPFDHICPWVHEQKDPRVVFGTEAFARLMAQKSAIILHALEKWKEPILYVDTDVVFSDTIAGQMADCFAIKPIWISTDSHWGFDRNPSLGVCMGIVAIKYESIAIKYIRMWHEFHVGLIEEGRFFHDQEAFNMLYERESTLYEMTGVFPITFAMPGWMYPAITPFNRLKNGVTFPPLFHCSFVLNDDEKIERMKSVNRLASKPHTWREFLSRVASLFADLWMTQRPSFRSILTTNGSKKFNTL